AQLRMPANAAEPDVNYVLHPAMMDGALQACVGLISSEDSYEPRLPFALDRLRVFAPCTTEMAVWARYAPGAQAGDSVFKLDVDLCDTSGNVCVQLRGLSTRPLSKELRPSAPALLLATPAWQASAIEPRASGSGFIEHHVLLCDLSNAAATALGALLRDSHCDGVEAPRDADVAERYTGCALVSFERIQVILQRRPSGKVLFQLVAAADGEQAILAGLSALLATATLENPQMAGQLILVPSQLGANELAGLLESEKAGSDPVIRYGQEGRQVLRWEEAAVGSNAAPAAFKDDGVYLVTGGAGGLGTLFTKEILERTTRARIVWTGRSPLSAEKQALLAELSGKNDRVSYRPVNLGDREQVARLIAGIEADFGALNGILHLAGMFADNFILRKSRAEFSDVLAPKVAGTLNLDLATKGAGLDFFVLFSSFAAAMGNVGQADYAVANAFMDHFAAYRNRQVEAGERHGRTRSINWPWWEAGGMRIDSASREILQQTFGVRALQTATGMQAFYHSLELPFAQVLVAEGDRARMRTALFARRIAPEPEPEVQVAAGAIPADLLAEKTQEYLRKELAGLLKLPAHRIDPQAALEKYGMDSILALKLTNRLEETFGSLSKTLFFEYQTIGELTRYFVQSHSARLSALLGTPGPVTQPETRPATPAKRISSRRFAPSTGVEPSALAESDAIAIIGLSGRYPEAVDLQAYWTNLRDGKDCVVEVPKERWDWREYYSEDRSEGGRHYSKWGGFIAGVDEFDPLFFNISRKEAKFIDPQERLFLQHAWMAVEDAGYTRAGLQVANGQDLPGQAGVYVGVMYSEYQLFGAEASLQGNRMGVAGSAASIANRVSYALNLHGPSMTLDTMCSSSLTAIHLACQDLKLGRTSLAIAGGVNVTIHPNKYLVLSAGQFISGDGHCQSFGEGGDGYIPGEGVGVVVLKRLSEAKRDGDHIYGIVRGSALNHGGKTNGYTVPNPQAQATVISRALAESKIDPRHISYVEAHGTGTKLGDPIEIAALSKAFQLHAQEAGGCLIGSAKSNIGHCESAAGIAGLTKVLLQMQHRQIVPSLHSAQLNPHIDFEATPFVVNQTLRDWDQPVVDGRVLPRIAGISSFGAGGSNAHILVEEYQAPVRERLAAGNVAILLSARTAEQLQQKARDLLAFVQGLSSGIDLAAMAHTLQVGREAMEERLGLVVSTADGLVQKLGAYVAGDETIEDVYAGKVRRNGESLAAFSTDADLQQTVEKWIAQEKLSKLLDLWVKGLDLDWSKLYGEVKPPRISLPTYPFARERCWIDVVPAMPAAARTGTIHPLVHSNASDPGEQCYRSTFTGEELFLADHHVTGSGKVLPSAAYLEMARAAIEHAFPAWRQSAVLELRDTAWGEPAVIAGQTQVAIALLPNGGDEIEYEIYSEQAGREIVHCHGRAVVSREPAPAAVDLEHLKRHAGADQVLAELRLSAQAAEYVLHPSVLEGALRAAAAVAGGAERRLPVAVEAVRIFAPCTQEMFAWVRHATGSRAADALIRLDIDLCDARGGVVAQLRGVSLQELETAIPTELPVIAETPVVPAVRRELVLAPAAFTASERKKPPVISLSAPEVLTSSAGEASRPAGRIPITLSSAAPGLPAETAAAPSVRLYDDGQGLFSIDIAGRVGAIAQLRRALDRVQQEASVKVLTIRGFDRAFAGGRDAYNEAVEQQLYGAIVSFPYPAIAVLEGETIGAGFVA
ncbi:MAG: polyketide synthase PksL, partial [Acidobacteriota bacterium]|nr:polyketide synthase PksL [Acidobacteriota bacterium]